ncbi:hypothetical protein ACTXT7_016768 [Hymenolepis weldensis]
MWLAANLTNHSQKWIFDVASSVCSTMLSKFSSKEDIVSKDQKTHDQTKSPHLPTEHFKSQQIARNVT